MALTAEDEELYTVTPDSAPLPEDSQANELGGQETSDNHQTVEDSGVQSSAGLDNHSASLKLDPDRREDSDHLDWEKNRRSRSRTYDSDSDSDSSSSSDDSDVIADRAGGGQAEDNSVDFESSVNEKRMQAMKAEREATEGKTFGERLPAGFSTTLPVFCCM